MERSSFFNAELVDEKYDRTYNAEDFARYFASFIGSGIFPNPTTNLQVKVDNAMQIMVLAGKAWINGYFYENTDELSLQLATADGVLNRIDRVVLRLNLINREMKCVVKQGASASTPQTPSIQRDSDIYELALADILVENGATKLTQSNITDQRFNNDLCGIVSGVVDQIDTTDLFTQFQSAFELWFDQIKGQLSEDAAGNLQLQIDEAVNKNGDIMRGSLGMWYGQSFWSYNNTSPGVRRELLRMGNDNEVHLGDIASPVVIHALRTPSWFDGSEYIPLLTAKGGRLLGKLLLNNGCYIDESMIGDGGIVVGSPLSGKDVTIIPGTEYTQFFTNSNFGFRFNKTMWVADNIYPNAHGQYWVGDQSAAFWGMCVSGGGFNQASDKRYKRDIRSVEDEEFHELLKNIEVHSYIYNGSDREDIGVIAQELANYDISDYLLKYDEQNGYSLNLYNYAAAIHSALRHEIQKREELEVKLLKLERRIDALEKEAQNESI